MKATKSTAQLLSLVMIIKLYLQRVIDLDLVLMEVLGREVGPFLLLDAGRRPAAATTTFAHFLQN